MKGEAFPAREIEQASYASRNPAITEQAWDAKNLSGRKISFPGENIPGKKSLTRGSLYHHSGKKGRRSVLKTPRPLRREGQVPT